MNDSLRSVRAAIRRHQSRRAHPRVHYPKAIRQAVVRLVRLEQAGGKSVFKVAQELGVSVNALKRWVEPAKERGRLERVVILKPAEPGVRASASREGSRPVLVTRQGHRVEGLDVKTLAELLEALS